MKIGDGSPLAFLQISKGRDQPLIALTTGHAARPRRDRMPMRAGLGMSKKSADLLLNSPVQEVFELTGRLVDQILARDVENIHKKPFGQPMTPDCFPGLFETGFLELHPFTGYRQKPELFQSLEGGIITG